MALGILHNLRKNSEYGKFAASSPLSLAKFAVLYVNKIRKGILTKIKFHTFVPEIHFGFLYALTPT